MAAYVDPVTGRQVVIETATHSGAASGEASAGAAGSSSSAGTGQGAEMRPPVLLDGEEYIDVDVMDRELARRESDRFYVLPDGTGVTRTVLASEVGSDAAAQPQVSAAVVGEAGAAWRRCDGRSVVPLVQKRADRRQVLQFPAVAARGLETVGYRVPVPAGAGSMTVWAILQKAHAVSPVLAALDGQGRVVAVAYSASTQTLPETAFRYGRVGFSVPVPVLPEGGALAVMDAALMAGLLPPRCMPIPDDAVYAPTSTGTLTLDFQ